MQIQCDPSIIQNMKALAQSTVQAFHHLGITSCCVCPGGRNRPLIDAIEEDSSFKIYHWPEERSAAFFALGQCKKTGQPSAVITTSGTAAGELLPAAMEAYYTGVPLLLVTADRPRRFRGTGAPQAAEQLELFGIYATSSWDVSSTDELNLHDWQKQGPAHLNLCFEDPISPPKKIYAIQPKRVDTSALDQFLLSNRFSFVVVGTLKPSDRHAVREFLLKLNLPTYLESSSGLREEPSLQKLRVFRGDNHFKIAESAHYPIDSILRIGGIPTTRTWRDLEDRLQQLDILSITDLPFSGLTGGNIIQDSINLFCKKYSFPEKQTQEIAAEWFQQEQIYWKKLLNLIQEEPTAEPSLIHRLSQIIPEHAHVYLGNSLPIREWDLAATEKQKHFQIAANRGVNGIDGQLSTFFGMTAPKENHWGIFGDLTTLYDLVAPWILPQLSSPITLVIINNSGAQLFSKIWSNPKLLNSHTLNFKPLADMWGMSYEQWTEIPNRVNHRSSKPHLIEIIPDNKATARFWAKLC